MCRATTWWSNWVHFLDLSNCFSTSGFALWLLANHQCASTFESVYQRVGRGNTCCKINSSASIYIFDHCYAIILLVQIFKFGCYAATFGWWCVSWSSDTRPTTPTCDFLLNINEWMNEHEMKSIIIITEWIVYHHHASFTTTTKEKTQASKVKSW